MKTIKKYTAIQIAEKNKNDSIVKPVFKYGDITGPHYNLQYPETEFDTEEEAIKWAYGENEYATWLIVPIVKFEIE